jgi:hypothetical protein
MKYFNIGFEDESITEKQLYELLNNVSIHEENYNGWSNRETWALNLHLNNTETLQNDLISIVKDDKLKDYEKEDELKDWVEEMVYNFIEGEEFCYKEEIKLLIQDVGSFWRINWREIINSNKDI